MIKPLGLWFQIHTMTKERVLQIKTKRKESKCKWFPALVVPNHTDVSRHCYRGCWRIPDRAVSVLRHNLSSTNPECIKLFIHILIRCIYLHSRRKELKLKLRFSSNWLIFKSNKINVSVEAKECISFSQSIKRLIIRSSWYATHKSLPHKCIRNVFDLFD